MASFDVVFTELTPLTFLSFSHILRRFYTFLEARGTIMNWANKSGEPKLWRLIAFINMIKLMVHVSTVA
ncbi:hypothetical protein CXF88_02660 [Shewanella sp. ALD9]|jgi:hypothetical protein|nr:hypothetical protein CXF88_02660 [Shewanella sp. ALD9]